MKNCVACEHEGKMAMADYVDVVYQTSGRHIYLRLCYNHSVELFKRGQTPFSCKYRISNEDKPREQRNPLSNFMLFNSFR
ncbi:hypothetical protein ACJVC5_07945 [Peredibacter sp. HCB2-198]|uniref:hypothetical protein n=1 Tax=Peredibacter sp. HCB2-198 TaxID=3383025 RepID=UPI0038B6AAD0